VAALSYEDVLEAARNLAADERERLIEELGVYPPSSPAADRTPKRSLLGLVADLGPAPSAEDIDEIRQEMWANFPRDDI